jgi:hypothetical protein
MSARKPEREMPGVHDDLIERCKRAYRATPSPDWFERLADTRRRLRAELEAKGIDVAARLKELGIEDDAPFEDPWAEGKPMADADPGSEG